MKPRSRSYIYIFAFSKFMITFCTYKLLGHTIQIFFVRGGRTCSLKIRSQKYIKKIPGQYVGSKIMKNQTVVALLCNIINNMKCIPLSSVNRFIQAIVSKKHGVTRKQMSSSLCCRLGQKCISEACLYLPQYLN